MPWSVICPTCSLKTQKKQRLRLPSVSLDARSSSTQLTRCSLSPSTLSVCTEFWRILSIMGAKPSQIFRPSRRLSCTRISCPSESWNWYARTTVVLPMKCRKSLVSLSNRGDLWDRTIIRTSRHKINHCSNLLHSLNRISHSAPRRTHPSHSSWCSQVSPPPPSWASQLLYWQRILMR